MTQRGTRCPNCRKTVPWNYFWVESKTCFYCEPKDRKEKNGLIFESNGDCVEGDEEVFKQYVESLAKRPQASDSASRPLKVEESKETNESKEKKDERSVQGTLPGLSGVLPEKNSESERASGESSDS